MNSKKTFKLDFFIVGAAKAGTTSLYQYLKQHPEVYLPPIKEVNFFCTDIHPKNFRPEYARSVYLDVDAYIAAGMKYEVFHGFPDTDEQHEKIFQFVSDKQLSGELSNTYLYSDVAAKNIHNKFPLSKIIILLRNPMERAFSHYQMDLRGGLVHDDFITEFNNDRHKIPKGWGVSNLYYELGLYYEQVKKYFDLFPKDQIHIILFDDLKRDKKKTMQSLCQFLNIDSSFEFDLEIKHNEAALPRNGIILWLKKRKNISAKIKKLIPEIMFSAIKKSAFSKKNLPELNSTDRKILLGYYFEDINKLSGLIGRDLTDWIDIA